ncbi:MAG: ABC transporter substrate-binding protein [Ottowia sp.]|nr:ABC transporter substrate-binding protein [Ottowia sp.]
MRFSIRQVARAAALGVSAGVLSLGLGTSAMGADPIRIGVVTFLSGPAAGTFGVPVRDAANAVLEEINAGKVPAPYATAGFGGAPIEFTFVDEAGGTTKQVTEFRNLVEQKGVDAVIGYVSSGDCLSIAPVAEELKKLTVMFDCGSPQVFEEGEYKYVFRTGATGTMDSVAAAMYLDRRGVEVNMYTGINQNYAWGHDSWNDFKASMDQLYPDAELATPQFPKFLAPQMGSEISAIMSSNAEVVHSSNWGGDADTLILQGVPRGLFSKKRVILTVGEPNLAKLGKQIPDGTIIGARGTFGYFAPDTELSRWFKEAYESRHKIQPTYPTYKMANAILGLKAAWEKAQEANGGKRPSQDQIIEAFEHATFEGTGGEVRMALGKGHQAMYDTAYGTVKHAEDGSVQMADVEHFAADEVTPPEGIKSLDWINSGFKN